MTTGNEDLQMESPLSGVRVLEIAQFIAGPFAGQQLADYGAEVIKIERPGGGDPFRTYVGGRNVPDYGCNFRAINRNKRSLVLDLSSPAAGEIVRRLAAEVDVVLENFRPGVMDRLGIGYEALKAVNPNIIYCAVAGFSPDGPYKNRPAFDTVGQGLSGMLYMFTDPEKPTMRGPTIADQVTALQAATAIMAMLRAKALTGKGGRIDISMCDAAASFIPDCYVAYTDAQQDVTSESRAAQSQACIMRCADDKLVAVQLASLQKAFVALVEQLGCPEMASDPRFAEQTDRRANWSDFIEALRPYFRAQPVAHWIERFGEAGVPFSEVLTIPEALKNPEYVHSGLFETREHPKAGAMTMIKRSARINKSRGPEQSFPPLLGEHSEEILRELGYDDQAITKMISEGLAVSV